MTYDIPVIRLVCVGIKSIYWGRRCKVFVICMAIHELLRFPEGQEHSWWYNTLKKYKYLNTTEHRYKCLKVWGSTEESKFENTKLSGTLKAPKCEATQLVAKRPKSWAAVWKSHKQSSYSSFLTWWRTYVNTSPSVNLFKHSKNHKKLKQ